MEKKVEVMGGCHCGAVRFAAMVDRHCEARICNCSICRMCGFQHLIVPASRFTLISGMEHLSKYRFKSRTAKHFFCSVCGVKSFYVPRSNPDGYSLNVRCLEVLPEVNLKFSRFDGQNWSRNAAKLKHLSAEGTDE